MAPKTLPASHPLHRMFRGLTEATFHCDLGIADPHLVDYVADLLVRFLPSQAVWSLRDGQGRRIDQVAAMLREAQAADDTQRRSACYRHVGDFTLFWTGVYPESLPRLAGSGSADHLINYQEQGKRSYYLASIHADEAAAPVPVLRRLSAEFERCAFGLSLVRREWERHDGEAEPGARRPILA